MSTLESDDEHSLIAKGSSQNVIASDTPIIDRYHLQHNLRTHFRIGFRSALYGSDEMRPVIVKYLPAGYRAGLILGRIEAMVLIKTAGVMFGMRGFGFMLFRFGHSFCIIRW